jgi:hypothetical protein
MPIDKVTAAQYAQQLATTILARNSKYDVAYGPIPDLVITPTSRLAESQNTRLRKVQSLLALVNNGDFTRDDLEAFVLNEGIRPDTGAPSVVTLIFSAGQINSNQTVVAGFPVATLADESTGQATTFVVVQTSTLLVANKSQYFNAVTQRYELPVTAQATTGGIDTNVGANSVRRPLRPLVGFDSVFNRDPAQGGRDATTDSDLIEQYLIAVTGTVESTPDGTRRAVRDLFTAAQDSLLVYGSDSLMTRAATDAGAVDLWVLGDQPISKTDIQTFIGVGQLMPLTSQPVETVTLVTSASTTYVNGVDFDFKPDTGTYAGSIRAQDGIVFRSTGAAPAQGAAVTIKYVQNALMTTITASMSTPDRDCMGRDLLVRAATQVDVVISATIKVRPGYNPTDVISLASDNILTFVNSLLLNARIVGVSDGGALQKSDVDAVVRRISGVDNFIFTVFDVSGGTGNVDIPIGKNQYPRLASTSLALTSI